MRYILEVPPNNAQNWGSTLFRAQERGELRIIDKGDSEIKLSNMMQVISGALAAFRNTGIDTELLIAWLRHKTNLNLKEIEEVIRQEQLFFQKMGLIK